MATDAGNFRINFPGNKIAEVLRKMKRVTSFGMNRFFVFEPVKLQAGVKAIQNGDAVSRDNFSSPP